MPSPLWEPTPLSKEESWTVVLSRLHLPSLSDQNMRVQLCTVFIPMIVKNRSFPIILKTPQPPYVYDSHTVIWSERASFLMLLLSDSQVCAFNCDSQKAYSASCFQRNLIILGWGCSPGDTGSLLGSKHAWWEVIHKFNVTFPDELFCHRLSILQDVLFHPESSCDYHVAGQVAEGVA